MKPIYAIVAGSIVMGFSLAVFYEEWRKSKMKARLPYQYQSKENAERYNALELFLFALLYCLKTEFGFGETRLRRLAQTLSQFVKDNENNNTWNDELRYWAEKNGINDIFR